MPHGAGAVQRDTLRFDVAYATAPFHDTFVHHPDTGRWTFRLDSDDGRGGRRPFAGCDVRPTSAADAAPRR